jgi:hypothetical protein
MPRLPFPHRPFRMPTEHEINIELLRDEARADRERTIGEHVAQRDQKLLDRYEAAGCAMESGARQHQRAQAWLRDFLDAGGR